MQQSCPTKLDRLTSALHWHFCSNSCFTHVCSNSCSDTHIFAATNVSTTCFYDIYTYHYMCIWCFYQMFLRYCFYHMFLWHIHNGSCSCRCGPPYNPPLHLWRKRLDIPISRTTLNHRVGFITSNSKAFKRKLSTIIQSLITTALEVFTIVDFLESGIESIYVVIEVDSMWISCRFYMVDCVVVEFDSVVR